MDKKSYTLKVNRKKESTRESKRETEIERERERARKGGREVKGGESIVRESFCDAYTIISANKYKSIALNFIHYYYIFASLHSDLDSTFLHILRLYI